MRRCTVGALEVWKRFVEKEKREEMRRAESFGRGNAIVERALRRMMLGQLSQGWNRWVGMVKEEQNREESLKRMGSVVAALARSHLSGAMELWKRQIMAEKASEELEAQQRKALKVCV